VQQNVLRRVKFRSPGFDDPVDCRPGLQGGAGFCGKARAVEPPAQQRTIRYQAVRYQAVRYQAVRYQAE
jgi:hypothetical protein